MASRISKKNIEESQSQELIEDESGSEYSGSDSGEESDEDMDVNSESEVDDIVVSNLFNYYIIYNI